MWQIVADCLLWEIVLWEIAGDGPSTDHCTPSTSRSAALTSLTEAKFWADGPILHCIVPLGSCCLIDPSAEAERHQGLQPALAEPL